VAQEIDALIRRADAADRQAADQLFALLYNELHRLAEHTLRRPGASVTLGTTTLLHEAYLNIAGRDVVFSERSRFLAYAARAMRGLVIDYARSRRATKRGRQFQITLATGDESPSSQEMNAAAELEQLGDALDELVGIEPALAELVDLHFFCGFSFGEIATMRDVSERTVQRDWRKARLLLHHAMLQEESASPGDGP
jgi:RNA polymerase sigma factor (TIGR02999 family)